MTTTKARQVQPETVARARDVERLIAGQATSDGAGVKLTRVLTQSLQRRLDPFLMLDAFGTDNPQDYIGGFPDHPHRGFETVTYMIAGRMQSTAERGGPFGHREVRNWMRASPPGIAFRYPRTESSPVGGGVPRSNSRKRALGWFAAACLTLGLALTGDALYIHALGLRLDQQHARGP